MIVYTLAQRTLHSGLTMTNADYCLKLIRQLYEGVDGFSLSLHARENEGCTHDSSLTYGELTEKSLVEMLAIVKPQPGEVFYDLGSGVGKPTLWASVLYPWHFCYGVERLKGLCEVSLQQKEKMLQHTSLRQLLPNRTLNIQFIQNDFLAVDFSDANVMLVNATSYTVDLWAQLTEKLLTLAPGTRIMVLTKTISLPEFELIHSGSFLMTWGMNSVNFYRKCV